MRCLLLVFAAAASTTTALAFIPLVTFGTGMIILELAATTTVVRNYLLSMHSPARQAA